MAQLIPFRRRREPEQTAPPLDVEELRREDRRRMLQNTGATILVVALVVLGFWIIEGVVAYSKATDCLTYRHRSCR